MHAKTLKLVELIDGQTGPDQLSKSDAREVLNELADHLQMSLEALDEEIDEDE
jgi:hypothetical protein